MPSGSLAMPSILLALLCFALELQRKRFSLCAFFARLKTAKNRHRGSGRPLAPATRPDMRVGIRRFGGSNLPYGVGSGIPGGAEEGMDNGIFRAGGFARRH